jgi:excisionase family DNA binding protein
MARMQEAGALLSQQDCALLDPLLVAMLRDLQIRDGGAPQRLYDIAAVIRGCSAEFRASVLVNPCSGTPVDSSDPAGGSSAPTERLTTQQAAQLTGLTDGYLRRLARRGDLTGSRSGRRGEWILDGNSVAAWAAEHRN